MIIQGSGNPIVIQFDTEIDSLPTLIISLWRDRPGGAKSIELKRWTNADMMVSGDTAVCPITEEESRAFLQPNVVFEAKGLDDMGNEIFWDEYEVEIKERRDKDIPLI